MKQATNLFMLMTALILVSGCNKSKSTDDNKKDSNETTSEKVNAAGFVLTSEPTGAKSVADTRDSARNKDAVVIVGRIGGTTHPWVEGAAAFTIVDESLPACGDKEDCGCPTPWDYCCETAETLAANSVTIKFADDNKRARRFSPKEVFGLTELQTIVVEGTVDRDDTGKFTILATKLFVKK